MLKKATTIFHILSGIVGSYCAVALLIMGWPVSGILAAIAAIGLFVKKGKDRLTTLGSARWADTKDLKRAGMLNAKTGVILGRINGDKSLVRLHQAVHTAIFAPTGVGKGVSVVIPQLLSSPESCVVMDFKGELAKATAKHRQENFQQEIAYLDPYRTVTSTPSTFNPLDFIEKDHRLAIDDACDIANALVVRTGEEHERHWNDSAEAVLAAVIATVIAYGEKGMRSLNTVQDILCNPQRLELAIKLMLQSTNWDGALARMGGQFLHFQEKEKASVLSTALRHTRFLGTPSISESVGSSSFDPSDLRKGRLTVFLILPPERAQAQSGLLRLWVGSLLRACVQGGLE